VSRFLLNRFIDWAQMAETQPKNTSSSVEESFDDDLERSVDGDLERDIEFFLKRTGLLGIDKEKFTKEEEERSTSWIIDGDSLESPIADMDLPNCRQLSNFINRYTQEECLTLSHEDIDSENNSVSVGVLEEWAASIYSVLSVLLDKQAMHHTSLQDASVVSFKDSVTIDALENKISELRLEAAQAKEREKSFFFKSSEAGCFSIPFMYAYLICTSN